MKKNMSWKFTDELSVTFQSSVSGVGEFGLSGCHLRKCFHKENDVNMDSPYFFLQNCL